MVIATPNLAGGRQPIQQVTMNSLTVFDQDGILVVDSRLVAEQLGVNHSDWFRNIIKKYESQIQQGFGILRFQNGEIKGRGQPEKFAWLTEDQCLFVMTLSRNTEQVIECKMNLVKAFSAARKKLIDSSSPKLLGAYTERVESMFDDANKIPDGYWCVLHESASLLVWIERKLKMPVNKADLLDGSIGIHWSNYRKDKPWAGDRLKFDYRFRDGRRCHPWCYQMRELEHFKYFVEDTYKPVLMPKYLEAKYPALVKV
jgi:phage regulator Rha-like protein